MASDFLIDPKTRLHDLLDIKHFGGASWQLPSYDVAEALLDKKTTKWDSIRLMATLLQDATREKLAKAVRHPPPSDREKNLLRLPTELLTMILCQLMTDRSFHIQLATIQHLSVVCKQFYLCIWSPEALKARHVVMPLGFNPNWHYRNMFKKKKRAGIVQFEIRDEMRAACAMAAENWKCMTKFPDIEEWHPDLWEIVREESSATRLQKAHAWQCFESRRLTWVHAVFMVIYGSDEDWRARAISGTFDRNGRLPIFLHKIQFLRRDSGPELRCTGCQDFLYLRSRSLVDPERDYVSSMEFALTTYDVLCEPCCRERSILPKKRKREKTKTKPKKKKKNNKATRSSKRLKTSVKE